MPTYSYTVRDNKGDIHYGSMESANPDTARLTLQNQGFWIINISQQKIKKYGGGKTGGRQKVSTEDLVMFAQQISAMIEADVPIIRTLDIVAKQSESKTLSNAIKEISTEIKAGTSLPEAFKHHPKIFSNLWVHLLKAGESTGKIPLILRQLVSYLEMRKSLEEKLLTALIYPIILISLTIAIILVFVFKIVPVFTTMFSNFGIELPMLTKLVISSSNFVKDNFLYAFIGIIAFIFAGKFYLKTEKGKLFFGSIVLKPPLIGKFVYNILLERFTSNLSIMIKSAVPILSSLETLENLFSDNLPFQRAISNIKSGVREGKSLSYSLGETNIFPTMLVQMITVGEETGKLPDLLEKAAAYYKNRLDRFITRFTVLIEPIIIIFVGAIVGVVVVAIFMPIFKIASLGGR